MTTNVICTDGTVIECAEFEAIESGVLLYFADEDVGDEDERDVELRPGAFVPSHGIRYVLPADIEIRPPPGMQSAGTRPEDYPAQQPSGHGRQPPGGPGRQPPGGHGGQSEGPPWGAPGTPPEGGPGPGGAHRPSPPGETGHHGGPSSQH